MLVDRIKYMFGIQPAAKWPAVIVSERTGVQDVSWAMQEGINLARLGLDEIGIDAPRQHTKGRAPSETVPNTVYILGVDVPLSVQHLLSSRWSESSLKARFGQLVSRNGLAQRNELDVQVDWHVKSLEELNPDLIEMMPELGEVSGPAIVVCLVETERSMRSLRAPALRRSGPPPLPSRLQAVPSPPSPAPVSTGWTATLIRGGVVVGEVPLAPRVLIGRHDEPNGISIEDDPKVSRRHAEIEVTAQGARIRDLSRNGTSLSGNTLAPQVWHAVHSGDSVQVGATEIHVRAEDARYSDTEPLQRFSDTEPLVP